MAISLQAGEIVRVASRRLVVLGAILVLCAPTAEAEAQSLRDPLNGSSAACDRPSDDESSGPSNDRVRFGVRLGRIWTTVRRIAHDVDISPARNSTAFGGSLHIRVRGHVFLQLELLHVHKGVMKRNTVYPSTRNLDYMEVPVLFGVELRPGRHRPYLLFGGHVSRLGGAGRIIKARDESDGTNDRIAATDYGPIVGLGVASERASGSRLTIEGRVGVGLAGLLEEAASAAASQSSLNVLLGYYF